MDAKKLHRLGSLRFSVREMLLLTMIVGLALGWNQEHRRLAPILPVVELMETHVPSAEDWQPSPEPVLSFVYVHGHVSELYSWRCD